jgi:hypothetical protein
MGLYALLEMLLSHQSQIGEKDPTGMIVDLTQWVDE